MEDLGTLIHMLTDFPVPSSLSQENIADGTDIRRFIRIHIRRMADPQMAVRRPALGVD